ncbi:uncharacterized protein BJ171DRAFT_510457 [Polychytrium aggregatum]|uniref:uncharacterized protein n=1 Tax=Polychytrium aggregatum TaxID=110093 RepID=UPI0022FDED33|nr:uncharacterized protein BJ171DRAFT_510457 [Polychytrium aggregatum]KAI9203357.1 hypothetical protein BJ171DRAFT_510457 [Polychytrium aggregatum]
MGILCGTFSTPAMAAQTTGQCITNNTWSRRVTAAGERPSAIGPSPGIYLPPNRVQGDAAIGSLALGPSSLARLVTTSCGSPIYPADPLAGPVHRMLGCNRPCRMARRSSAWTVICLGRVHPVLRWPRHQCLSACQPLAGSVPAPGLHPNLPSHQRPCEQHSAKTADASVLVGQSGPQFALAGPPTRCSIIPLRAYLPSRALEQPG